VHGVVAHRHAESAPESGQVDGQWLGPHLPVELRGHRDADCLIGDCEDARDRPILSAAATGTVPDRMRAAAALAISQSFVVGVLLIYVQRRMQGIMPRAAVTVSVRAGGPPVTRAPRRDLRGAAGELTLGMRSARLEVVEVLSSGGASTML